MIYVTRDKSRARPLTINSSQSLNTDDNPALVMPDKPPPEIKGSGAEFYNVDFSLYNQRKVAGLKPAQETMPQSKCCGSCCYGLSSGLGRPHYLGKQQMKEAIVQEYDMSYPK